MEERVALLLLNCVTPGELGRMEAKEQVLACCLALGSFLCSGAGPLARRT